MADSTELAANIPPARLLAALSPFMGRADYDSQPTGQVLSEMFGRLPSDARPSWYLAFVDLIEIVQCAQDYVRERVPNYADTTYARTHDAFSRAMSDMAVWDPWGSQRQKLEPIVMYSLPYWLDVAPPAAAPRMIAASDVSEIRATLNELVELILASDYPHELKAELTKSLQVVLDRITRFAIFGPEGVKAATAGLVGALAVNAATVRSRADVIEKSAGLINKLADVFLKGYAIAQLTAAAVTRLLGPG